MVIAPATASTIAKMACGVADNMLVTTYLSAKAPVFVAPAMDLDMMATPPRSATSGCCVRMATMSSTRVLNELASHLVGKGRMAEPEEILEAVDAFLTLPRQ